MSDVEKKEPGPTEAYSPDEASPIEKSSPEPVKKQRQYKDFGEEKDKPTRTSGFSADFRHSSLNVYLVTRCKC
jgi:hypothetical protein